MNVQTGINMMLSSVIVAFPCLFQLIFKHEVVCLGRHRHVPLLSGKRFFMGDWDYIPAVKKVCSVTLYYQPHSTWKIKRYRCEPWRSTWDMWTISLLFPKGSGHRSSSRTSRSRNCPPRPLETPCRGPYGHFQACHFGTCWTDSDRVSH